MKTKNNIRISSAEELNMLSVSLKAELEGKTIISVCSGTGCKAYSSDEVYAEMEKQLSKTLNSDPEKAKKIVLKRTGCHGFCERGPIIIIHPEETCYLKSKIEDVPEILEKTLNGEKVERLLFKDNDGNPIAKESEIPFYKYQKRIILGNNSKLDPANIGDYIRLGGYEALAKVLLERNPDGVIEEVKKSNLRGRGGGGFPVGLKWQTTKNAQQEPKYIIVNADEGDPGAFMDRSILEGNPHSVLEGLIIAAYAIGSNLGFVYVRQEYPLAVKNLEIAISQAREYGFIGENILNSGFNFDIKTHRGAGAFVSGESSALMTAIEGFVGEPRLKYTHTAVSGLWSKPTNLNNVETYANIPHIINNGAEWFKSIGTEGSSGTKIFSLVGKVNNTGLVEVPMGITLRDIIYKIGGGVKGGKKFKVQTGGPSGGIIPEQLLDLPVDFDELYKAGSMMGSGGMIVMDESDCMVNIAQYFINFLSDESCGKCVPCREGLRQMAYVYERITSGQGKEEDIKLLEDLSVILEGASLCALGGTAQNIVVSTLKHFRDEYDAHIFNKSCPALVCKPLIHYNILSEKCTGCLLCLKACPVKAITGEPKKLHVINQDLCTKCGACIEVCPVKFNAIEKNSGN